MIWNESNFFRRYAPLLVLAMLFGGLFGYLQAARRPHLYRASATLQLPPGRAPSKVVSLTEQDEPRPEFMTELLILKSDRLGRRVIGELNLAGRAEFLGFDPPSHPDAKAHEQLIQQCLLQLRQRFIVSIVAKTDLATLNYTSHDPALAAAIVNRFADDFLEDRFERHFTGAGRGEQMLAGRLTELREEFTANQRRLLALQQTLQAPGFSPRTNQIAADLARLSSEERAARLSALADQDRAVLLRAEAARARAEGRELVAVPLAAPPPSPDQPNQSAPQDATARAQQDLRRDLNEARSQQARASALLGPNHPSSRAAEALVNSYEQELAGENTLILSAAEQRAQASAADEAGIHAAFLDRVREADSLEPTVLEYTALERKYVFARVLYYRFLTRLRAAVLDAGLAQSNVYVVDRAEIPAFPIGAPLSHDAVKGALFSLAFAWILALVLRYRSNLLVRVEHVEGVTGLPALATLPQLRSFVLADYARILAGGRAGIADDEGSALFVDGLFDIAAQLAPPVEPTRSKRVLLTSSSPGEGKTSISSALAMTLAHGGRRVLLIDADLHRPMVARRLGLNERIGLSNVLSGGLPLTQAVLPAPGTAHLDVLTSGPMPQNPDRMLASRAMTALLAEAAELYAVIVIDAPPVLAVQDALVLTQLADEVVWVMRDLNTKAWLTRRTRKLLEEVGAPVRGLVINGTALPRKKPRAVPQRVSTLAG